MKNRKGAVSVALIIAILAIFGIGGYVVTDGFTDFTFGTQAITDDDTGIEFEATEFCSNNPTVNLRSRYRDILATSATSREVNWYLVDLSNGGTVTNVTNGDDESGSDLQTEDDAIICNHAYDVYVQSATNDNALISPYHLDASDTIQKVVTVDVEGTQYDSLRARVYDDSINDGYVFSNGTADGACLTTTTFCDLQYGAGSNTLTFDSTTNATATTINSDEEAIWIIQVRTNATLKEFGYGAYIAIDTEDSTNTADVDEDTVSLVVGGTTLTDVSNSIPANDQKALSSYEMIYKVAPGIIRQDITEIRLSYKPESGTNPDFDVKVRFVPLGTYLDDDDPNSILTDVGFRTDSSRTALLDSVENTLTLNIA